MLPPDLSGHSESWLASQIDRRDAQIQQLPQGLHMSATVRQVLEDEIAQLQAALAKAERHRPEPSLLNIPARYDGSSSPEPTLRYQSDGVKSSPGPHALLSNAPSSLSREHKARRSFVDPRFQYSIPSGPSFGVPSSLNPPRLNHSISGQHNNGYSSVNSYLPNHHTANQASYTLGNTIGASPLLPQTGGSLYSGTSGRDAMSDQQSLRKRGLSSPSSKQDGRRYKATRRSPSPINNPADDFDTDIPDDVLAALGADMDPAELRSLLGQQREIYSRAKQEVADAEMAKTLASSRPGATQPDSRPSTSNTHTSVVPVRQTYFDPSGSFHQSKPSRSQYASGIGLPPSASSLYTSPVTTPSFQRDEGASPFGFGPGMDSFGNDPGMFSKPRPVSSQPNLLQTTASGLDSGSSSDLEEIQASDFFPSEKSKQLGQIAGNRKFPPNPGHRVTTTPILSHQMSYGDSPITYRPRPGFPNESAASSSHISTGPNSNHGIPGFSVYQSPSVTSSWLPKPVVDAAQRTSDTVRSLASTVYNLTSGNHSLLEENWMEDLFSSSDEGDSWSRGKYGNPYGSGYDTIDSTQRAEEIKKLIHSIRPDEELENDEYTRNPDDLAADCPLYDHQKLGLAWLRKMEEGSNKGGILADDMGLGKTVQAIALMISRRSLDPQVKTNLIVAPVSLLKQWEAEIKAKVKPGRRLSTIIFHGASIKNMTWNRLKTYDVVLTTYGTLGSEYSRLQLNTKNESMASDQPGRRDPLPLVLLDKDAEFFRIILDEAQHIRNRDTRNFKAVLCLKAQTRFCMTGTPMMNNVGELQALIAFLKIRPYQDFRYFQEHIGRPLKAARQNAEDAAMTKLRALLKAILLRRTKTSEIKGQPILILPERKTVVEHVVLVGDQLAFYQALESRTQLRFNRYLKQGRVGHFYGAVLLLLLRLRQACCHPHLIKNFEVDTAYLEKSAKDLDTIARENLSADVVRRIKEESIVDCPICMDVVENAMIFTPCGHRTCSECFTRISDPGEQMAEDNGRDPVMFKCMACRGKVDPSKVTDWKAFQRVHMQIKEDPDPLKGFVGLEVLDKSDSDDASDTGTESDLDESESLDGFIVSDSEEKKPSRRTLKIEDDQKPDTMLLDEKDDKKKMKRKSKKRKRKEKMKGKEKAESAQGQTILDSGTKQKTLAELQKESRRNAAARRRYFEKLTEDWVTSAKIDRCVELLDKVTMETDDEKVIVFSQFTSFLDLIEVALVDKPWTYGRYDGSMSSTARNDAVQDFSNKKQCRVLLVSLKAGNAGLNLTAANHVIILDPFWNPYVEEQAVDRAHRIGQRRTVYVHRILIQGTVEDRIMDIQKLKRGTIDAALDEKQARNIGRLTDKDLAHLFGVS